MQAQISRGRLTRQGDLHYYLLLLFAVTLPIPFNAPGNILVLMMAVNWLLMIVCERKITFKSETLSVLAWPVMLFACYAASMIYSADFKDALSMVMNKFHFLFLPLIIFTVPCRLSKKNYQMIFIAFLSACVVVSLLCVVNTFYRNYQEGIIFVYYNSWYFSGENLVARFGINHIHFAMYFCLCAVFTAHLIVTSRNRYLTIFLILLLLYIVMFIMALSSRMALITLFLLPCLFIFYWFEKNILFKLLATLHLLVFLIIFGFQFPVVQEKFTALLSKDNTENGRYQSAGRMAAWQNSLSIIADNWVIGVGVGDLNDELLKKYHEAGTAEALSDDQKIKNQYLEMAGTTGIIGLACLLFTIAIPAYKASKKKNFIFLAFLQINALFFIVESMLFTPKGAAFFIYFYCILGLGMLLKDAAPGSDPGPQQPEPTAF